MIDLNFKRDEQGFYIIDDQLIKSDKQINLTIVGDPESFNFWVNNNGKRFLLKFGCDNNFLFSLYGEMLFSKFAEKNGIPCAKIDVAKYVRNGVELYAVLSQDITSQNSETITLYHLLESAGRKSYGITVRSIQQAANKYLSKLQSEGVDVRLADNFNESLKMIASADMLCYQSDRNEGGMLFEIVETSTGKVLKVCPCFDNEAVFEFPYLGMEYQYGKEEIKQILEGMVEGDKSQTVRFPNWVKTKMGSILSKNCPIVGLEVSTDDRDYSEEDLIGNRYNAKSLEELVANLALDDFSSEMTENSQFKKMIEGFTFDTGKFIDEIKKETGFEIPAMLAVYAEFLFESRKKQLLELAQEYEELKGED